MLVTLPKSPGTPLLIPIANDEFVKLCAVRRYANAHCQGLLIAAGKQRTTGIILFSLTMVQVKVDINS